jgi:hypothetical protein
VQHYGTRENGETFLSHSLSLSLSKHGCNYALVVFAFFVAFPLPALATLVNIDMELLYDMEVVGLGRSVGLIVGLNDKVGDCVGDDVTAAGQNVPLAGVSSATVIHPM